ncbi:hypothetical protein [Phenylobacterium sp. J367]|uniref:hypothetical protein n=1 Tax=Phenylobacterium sp. J367 TaxID=2898435 RepID=UPI0021516DF9|nr:hypothetical protein [Phenylobacterium sp. J367]MCR5877827.1 hypothetical protein [Phenylobacterium sp. J367]
MTMRTIPAHAASTIGDFRRYPGCRLLLSCAACGWSRTYNPERVIGRLQELRAGGHTTRLTDVRQRIGWNCPRCARMRWRMAFAWPPGLGPAEVKRLTAQARN